MVDALVWAVGNPADGIRVVDVAAIRKVELGSAAGPVGVPVLGRSLIP